MFWGIALLVFGLIWYLNETGMVSIEPFWPSIVILAGLVLLVKAFLYKPKAEKRRR